MALSKEVEIGNTGLFCNYIKIQSLLFESENGLIQIQFGIYSSQEASHSGKEPISRFNKSLNISDLSAIGDIREQIYFASKMIFPELEGAIDV